MSLNHAARRSADGVEISREISGAKIKRRADGLPCSPLVLGAASILDSSWTPAMTLLGEKEGQVFEEFGGPGEIRPEALLDFGSAGQLF
jgi:hypothetical protein